VLFALDVDRIVETRSNLLARGVTRIGAEGNSKSEVAATRYPSDVRGTHYSTYESIGSRRFADAVPLARANDSLSLSQSPKPAAGQTSHNEVGLNLN